MLVKKKGLTLGGFSFNMYKLVSFLFFFRNSAVYFLCNLLYGVLILILMEHCNLCLFFNDNREESIAIIQIFHLKIFVEIDYCVYYFVCIVENYNILTISHYSHS